MNNIEKFCIDNGVFLTCVEDIKDNFVAKADIIELLKRADIYCKEDIIYYLNALLNG